MPGFTGQLNANEIFAACYNMIISQEMRADNVAGTFSSLVDRSRVDGSLYGDTKLYYDADVLKSHEWLGDAEATNLLATDRPAAPECQAIVLNIFRQIRITIDNYLSKRMWINEYAFSSFNGVMLGMIRTTKKVYDSTTFNSYIGTAVAASNGATLQLSIAPTGTVSTVADEEAAARIQAQKIAEGLANLFINLKDVSRDYNDYGHLKSYDLNDLIVVWNSKWVNTIKKIDMPTMFHKDGLIDKFEEEILPARYFGNVNATGGTVPANNTTIRALVEKDYVVSGVTTHCFAGDPLPAGAAYLANETYTLNGDIICKVIHKKSVPFMSAFEVGTSFFNARSLTENHYLTWGHNTIEYLKSYPFIKVTAQVYTLLSVR